MTEEAAPSVEEIELAFQQADRRRIAAEMAREWAGREAQRTICPHRGAPCAYCWTLDVLFAIGRARP